MVSIGERRAQERQREQPDQPERLHRLLVTNSQPGICSDAADRHPEHHRQQKHGDRRDEAVGEPEPTA
jgi:hypothetical protein